MKPHSTCLQEIGTVDIFCISEYVKKAEATSYRASGVGFGHRVYKNYSPRAKVMQKTCHEVSMPSATVTIRR